MNKLLKCLKITLIAVFCLSLSLLLVACGEPGEKGDKGDTGAQGVGIVSIAKESTTGNVDIYKITLSNGNTSTFTVTNGTNGEEGKSAYEIYKQYNPDYTGSEQQWINDLVNGKLAQPDGQTPVVTDFDYIVTGNQQAIIIDYKGTNNQVEIPETIDNKKVVAIDDNVFKYNNDITSIKIPNSVESIGEEAFYNCDGLTQITIPNSVKSIGEDAFYDCDGLTQITIPNSVKNIGESAFSGCGRLQKVYITDLSAWCNINFANEYANPLFVISADLYVDGIKTTNLVIPADVKEIKSYAFCDSNIESLSFAPDSQLTTIANRAFMWCEKLTSVTLPKNGKITLESASFESCYMLENIILPANVEIKYSTFAYCYDTIVFCEVNGPADWWDENWRYDATYYWYSENTPTTDGNYWKYVDGVPTILQATGPTGGLPGGSAGGAVDGGAC